MIEHGAHEDASLEEIESVHRAFYAAWEAADLQAATALWLDDDEVSICFPGGTPTWGRAAVVDDLAEALELTRGIQFLFEDLRVSRRGDIARLTCIEHVVMPGEATLEEIIEMPSSRLAVSSTLVRTEAGWRLWNHMSGPVLIDVERE